MICVSQTTIDEALAWRVRDALARHPLLGGAMARIQIDAGRRVVTLEGWVMDRGLEHLALSIAVRAAGSRPVRTELHIQRHNTPPIQARLYHLGASPFDGGPYPTGDEIGVL